MRPAFFYSFTVVSFFELGSQQEMTSMKRKNHIKASSVTTYSHSSTMESTALIVSERLSQITVCYDGVSNFSCSHSDNLWQGTSSVLLGEESMSERIEDRLPAATLTM